KDIEVDRARAGETRTGLRHCLHHQRRFGEPKPRAANAFRHCNAEPAAFRYVVDERVREVAAVIGFQPIMVVILRADFFDRVFDRGLLFSEVEGERHDGSNLSGDNAAQRAGISLPNTYAVMISAVIGAMSQPSREWPAASRTPWLEGPIMGHPSGDMGRMPAQAFSVSFTSPGNRRSAAACNSATLARSTLRSKRSNSTVAPSTASSRR